MKLLKNKITTLGKAIEYVTLGLRDEKYSINLLSDAPFWLRLLSRGQYCSYRNTVYAPSFHLELVSAKSDETRSIATAKLLPHIMMIRDCNGNVSKLSSLLHLFNIRYQIHYFIYELMMLRSIKHPLEEPISLGFITSRKRFGIRLNERIVYKFINATLANPERVSG